ncbi:MAG: ABC transporter ATP-binding protein [Pseudomonadota bacterium]|nr:ABC transporter ATP-binding protein [Pseudomonadota bacterium]
MPDIRLRGLTRRYGDIVAVNDVTMTFPEATVTCLLGPSGCGKTTLMRMIAGLETPTSGTIAFGERDVTRLPTRKRDVGMVFQYPVMYRTATVQENIELALQHDRSFAHADRRRRVDEVLEVLRLSEQRHLLMAALDSGTRQKVAVGRAIARSCDVILFDEPTTNVEVNAKLALIRAFKEFRTRFRQTIIYVTHDQTEAMTLADQIALMRDGVISQCSPPRALYDRPDSEFGGWFLGNPGMNFLEPSGECDGALVFDVFAHPLAVPGGAKGSLRAGIRPEYVGVRPAGAPGAVPARLLRRAITIGGQYLLTLAVGGSRLKAKIAPDAAAALSAQLAIECPLEHVVLFRDGVRLADEPQAVPAPVAFG